LTVVGAISLARAEAGMHEAISIRRHELPEDEDA
jgi:hypothetical protein